MSKSWNQKELQNYVDDGIEESLSLEYKAADSLGKSDGKKKEITKDVSAMANSSGGIIIYGIKEFDESDKRHLPERLDSIKRTEFSKEWLEQVINNIRPHIHGIVIHSVNIATGSDQVVYVVEIPKGDTAHQATDHRYYKRYNFQSVPMEDYEIRDVMGRRQQPKIELSFDVEIKTKYKRDANDIFVRTPPKIYSACKLIIKATNVGGTLAKYVNCFISIPEELLSEDDKKYISPSKLNAATYYQFYRENTVRDVVDTKLSGLKTIDTYGPARFAPILPSLSHSWSINLDPNLTEINLDNLQITWEIYADNALPAKGSIPFNAISIDDLRDR